MNPFLAVILSGLLIGLAFYFPYYFGEFEAKNDAIKIVIIGSKNPNENPLHFFSIIKRSVTAGFFILIVSTGLFYMADFHRWFALPYLFYFPAAFSYNYTRTLNQLRGLHTWYVSGSKEAKRLDRSIRRWAYRFKKTPQDFNEFYHFWYLIIAGVILISYIFFELVFGEWIIRIR